MSSNASPNDILEWTTTIVAAHLRSSEMDLDDLPSFIRLVHRTLTGLSDGAAMPAQAPAVPVKRSVTPDYIICLEDGMKLKMLKRHLSTSYNMTPEQYREKWGLPPDYPMVAPSYARQRSSLAKKIGLGTRGRSN